MHWNRSSYLAILFFTFLAIGFFTLPFVTGEWCVSDWPTEKILRKSRDEFMKSRDRPKVLAELDVDRNDLLKAAADNKICELAPPSAAPRGGKYLAVVCSIHGKSGRVSGIEYYITHCGWIGKLFRYDENT